MRLGDFGVRIPAWLGVGLFCDFVPICGSSRSLCAELDCLSEERFVRCWQEEEVLATGRVEFCLTEWGPGPGLARFLFRKLP